MRKNLSTLVLAVLVAMPALAQEGGEAGKAAPPATTVTVLVDVDNKVVTPANDAKGFGIGNQYVQFTGRIQSLVLWRNDSDFDRTPPYYNASGQDVGVLGTFLAPMLVVTPLPQLKMVLEAELGLNLWSMQDADTYGASSPSWLRMALRQAYAEGNFLGGHLGFRVGYERMFDPTGGLFVGHWLGAADVWAKGSWGQLSFTVAQLPDQTYEGIGFDANNFKFDSILYGLRFRMPFDKLTLDTAVYGLHDAQVVRRTQDLMTLMANLGGDWGWLKFGVGAGLQYGVTKGRAAGDNETTLAWAAQGFLDVDKPVATAANLRVQFRLNTLALSADDDYEGNRRNGAWFYSGKSMSRTLLLTEDEVRDRGGNIDELMSQRRNGNSGKHFVNRPGLSVTDATIGVQAWDWFQPSLTVGAGFALNPDNALGSRFVGLETDLRLAFLYKKYLAVELVGSYLLPGKAAAAFVNRTGDRGSTDNVLQTEASVVMYF